MLTLTRRVGESVLIDAGESGVTTVIVAGVNPAGAYLIVASPGRKTRYVDARLHLSLPLVGNLFLVTTEVDSGRCHLSFGGDKLPVWRPEALMTRPGQPSDRRKP